MSRRDWTVVGGLLAVAVTLVWLVALMWLVALGEWR